jgi:hypothetical protein
MNPTTHFYPFHVTRILSNFRHYYPLHVCRILGSLRSPNPPRISLHHPAPAQNNVLTSLGRIHTWYKSLTTVQHNLSAAAVLLALTLPIFTHFTCVAFWVIFVIFTHFTCDAFWVVYETHNHPPSFSLHHAIPCPGADHFLTSP